LALLGKEIPGVRLERHDAAGHTALARFANQQRKHGLVAAVHAVEVADGQRTRAGDFGVVKAAKNLHGVVQVCNKAATALG
jgi:hypothetical protein